ncbi:MAG: Uma2 family endonuclease [Chloroflexota bacterium]|nr:Uma2 family endonuclease [Chloroflexota bacterium]
MVEVKPLLVPADIERMLSRGEIDPDAMFELVDGEILWLSPTNSYHARICTRIIRLLGPFADRIGADLLDGQAGFMVGARRQQLRSPDVSLVAHDRLNILRREGFAAAAPDLAVEVLSEGQRSEAYARPKVGEYLAAGASVVWLIDPDARTVRVYEPGRNEYAVHPAETDLTLDQIAPGFSVRVSTLFPS